VSSEWTDEEFLQYVETHSQTPRALFSDEHVRRLCRLAGREAPQFSGFLAVHYETAKPLIDAARTRLT